MNNPRNCILIALLVAAVVGSFITSVYYGKVSVITSFLAVVGGGVAISNYYQSVKIKRIEWLLELFHRYMDESKFRRIRYIIVFRVTPEYGVLKDLMQNRAKRKVDQSAENYDKSLIMDMDDYLNYFELIATLWLKGEMKRDEIEMLYHDYIKYLWQIDFTHAYITHWGFESLTKLATELFGAGPLGETPPESMPKM